MPEVRGLLLNHVAVHGGRNCDNPRERRVAVVFNQTDEMAISMDIWQAARLADALQQAVAWLREDACTSHWMIDMMSQAARQG